jgi:two-component system nitrogen regulation sensor histidine kinase NtrY
MAADKRIIRRKRTRIAILLCIILIPVLTYLETVVFKMGEVALPVSGNVLVFSLINVNIILLLLMVFLVLRNLLRFIFEQRQLALGKSLRTRLVIAFISLSLIPTVLLFFIALQFVSTSMDYWFNSNVEDSLDESLRVAQDIYQQARDRSIQQGKLITDQLESNPSSSIDQQNLEVFLHDQLTSHSLDGLLLYSGQRQILAEVQSDSLNDLALPEVPAEGGIGTRRKSCFPGKQHRLSIPGIDNNSTHSIQTTAAHESDI